jgi:hypothetical protein
VAIEWKVLYKDGRERVITSEKYGPYGDNHVFESADGIIAVIDRSDVESVMRADIPDATRRAPKVGAV